MKIDDGKMIRLIRFPVKEISMRSGSPTILLSEPNPTIFRASESNFSRSNTYPTDTIRIQLFLKGQISRKYLGI